MSQIATVESSLPTIIHRPYIYGHWMQLILHLSKVSILLLFLECGFFGEISETQYNSHFKWWKQHKKPEIIKVENDNSQRKTSTLEQNITLDRRKRRQIQNTSSSQNIHLCSLSLQHNQFLLNETSSTFIIDYAKW